MRFIVAIMETSCNTFMEFGRGICDGGIYGDCAIIDSSCGVYVDCAIISCGVYMPVKWPIVAIGLSQHSYGQLWLI